MKVDFDYSIGETVKIKAINVIGSIDGMQIENCGKLYRIVYWNDGQRYSTWLYSEEIGKIS